MGILLVEVTWAAGMELVYRRWVFTAENTEGAENVLKREGATKAKWAKAGWVLERGTER